MIPTEKKGIKIAAQNRKAYHDYFVEDKYEAGIELCGTEVKSIRAGTMNLKDSYCTVKDGELFVHSMHISSSGMPATFFLSPTGSGRQSPASGGRSGHRTRRLPPFFPLYGWRT